MEGSKPPECPVASIERRANGDVSDIGGDVRRLREDLVEDKARAGLWSIGNEYDVAKYIWSTDRETLLGGERY